MKTQKNKKEKLSLLEMPIGKALMKLTIPIIFANILQITYSLTNNFWIGRYSEDSFAALTLAGNVIFLIISLWIWFAIAWSILVAQNFWAKKKEELNKIAAQGMTTMTITWIILSIVLYFASPFILHLMWAGPEIFNEALSYIKISFLALIFVFSFLMFQAVLRWIWEVKLPIYIVSFSVILNFIFAPLLIFGYGPFPEMWVKWAAIMTLITEAIATIIWFYVLFKWNYWIKTTLKDYIPDIPLIKETFKLWIPSSIEAVTRSLSFTLMTTIVSYIWAWLLIQSVLLAAYWIGGTVIQMTILVAMALTQATTVLVWQYSWAANAKKAREVVKTVSKVSFYTMTLLWVIIFILAPNIIEIFIPNSPEINYYWTQMVRTSSLLLWLVWLQMAWSWVLRATWNTDKPMYVTVFSNIFIKLPFAYFFSKYAILWLNLWVKWIWFSEVVAILILTPLMWFALSKLNWEKICLIKKVEPIKIEN